MMLTVVFFLLIGGAFSLKNSECRRKESEACESPGLFTVFPLTKEDMDSKCREGLKFLRCTKDGFNKCSENEVDDNEILGNNMVNKYITRLTSYIENAVCNEQSVIYQDLSSNLRCMDETMRTAGDNVCKGEYLNKKTDLISKSIEGFPFEDREDIMDFQLHRCLRRMIRFACEATILADSCNSPNLGQTISEVAINVDPHFVEECPEDVVSQMPTVLQGMRSAIEAEKAVEKVMKRRRK